MPNVILIAHTPSPEKTIASAAKLCYSSSNIMDLYDGLTDEKAADFVEMLSEIGHESPIEHASFTFGIEGVSRSLLAQITRHRIASFAKGEEDALLAQISAASLPGRCLLFKASHKMQMDEIMREVEKRLWKKSRS